MSKNVVHLKSGIPGSKGAVRGKKNAHTPDPKASAVRKVKTATARTTMAAGILIPQDTTDTINSFVKSINNDYKLQLPTLDDFPQGTLYYQMWSLPVQVEGDPNPKVLKKATATTSFTLVLPQLGIIVFIEVRQAATIHKQTPKTNRRT